jgi:hypothetical protein
VASVWAFSGSVETSVGVVEVVGGGADGLWVSSWPASPGELVVVRPGLDHVLLGGSSLVQRVGESGSCGSSFGWEGGVEVGELTGEPLAGETQGFDTEGERVVAPTTR